MGVHLDAVALCYCHNGCSHMFCGGRLRVRARAAMGSKGFFATAYPATTYSATAYMPGDIYCHMKNGHVADDMAVFSSKQTKFIWAAMQDSRRS